MKTSAAFLSALLSILAPSAQAATVITYDRLEAGSNNSFGPDATISGMLAVGTNNILANQGSSAFGKHNVIDARHSLAVGMYNQVHGYYDYDSSMLAVGWNNFLGGPNSLVVGTNNDVITGWDFAGGYNCLVSGSNHVCYGVDSLVSGFNNQIPYILGPDYEIGVPVNVTLHGSGLICHHHNCTVVGKNNVWVPVYPYDPPAASSPLFVVGNGSSASNRSNALEVHDNGDIIISKPQGDISMGIYGP